MSKTVFTIKLDSVNEMQKKTRKVWGFMPATKAFKSKRDFNRRNTKMIERAARLGLD